MPLEIRTVLALLALSAQVLAQESASVELAEVRSEKLEQAVVVPGELRPFQQVDLRARVEGFVERIPVDRGSRVRRGDLLALLRAPELEARSSGAVARLAEAEADLAESQAKLAASESTYERLAKAAETPGVVAGNELVQAQKRSEADRARAASSARSLEAARAARDAVGEMTSYLRVTAPFDGVVTERYVHVGALVGPGSVGAIVRLEQIHRLRLVVPVPEAYAMAVSKGAEVPFSVSAYPSEIFSAVVSRPSLSVSRETRTMAVEADVDNGEGRLVPGMYAEVAWPMRRDRESLFVPRGAVVENTERVFVIRVRDGQTEWVDVRRGAFQGNEVEVFGPLAAGDRVVLRASDELRPGTSVVTR